MQRLQAFKFDLTNGERQRDTRSFAGRGADDIKVSDVANPKHRVLASLALALVVGFCIGFVTWGEGRAPTLVVMLPLIVAIMPKRAYSAAFVFGYVMALLRTHPAFLAGWFGGDVWLGWAICSGFALASVAVWSTGWNTTQTSSKSFLGQQSYRLMSMVLAWLLAFIPPFAIFVPANPIVGWGYLSPGFAWFGVIASLIVPMLAMLAWFLFDRHKSARLSVLLVVTALIAWHGLSTNPQAASVDRPNAAISTTWGKVTGMESELKNIERIGNFVRHSSVTGVKTYFWPESIVGVYEPSMASVMSLEVLKPAADRLQTHVIGMDLQSADGSFKSVAVAYYPDGRTAVAQARQPAPVALWRPWSPKSYVADWHNSNTLLLNSGQRAAVIFCYEEYIPALFLLTQIADYPDLYVAMTNTWASQSTTAASIQSAHSIGMARLFGLPFIKAENRPMAQ